MNGGFKFLASAAVLALAGCGGSQAKLEIRSLPGPISATAKPMSGRLAEAHGHLALGNVALALESYRKALREQPDSVAAMVGLADCYDRMTRFDLSRRYYEAALAVVPADTKVLNALARSLDVQGRADEAASVRQEIGVRLAAAKPSPAPAIPKPARSVTLVQAAAPVAGPSVTLALPPPKPFVAASSKATEGQAKPKPVQKVAAAPTPALKVISMAPPATPDLAAKLDPASPAATRRAATLGPVEGVRAPRPVAPAAQKPAQLAAGDIIPATRPTNHFAFPAAKPTPPAVLAASASFPPLPVVPAPLASAPAMAAGTPVLAPPPLMPARVVPTPTVEQVAPPAPAPIAIARFAPVTAMPRLTAHSHLVRVSPGEVALVTTSKPQWRSHVVGRTAQSTTIRYVPLLKADVRVAQIRLLNAARYRGLATRTRSLLANRGWRQLAIGDATRARRTSLILYPSNRRATAERLAKQFGFPIEKRVSGHEFVVLLGYDATRTAGARTGG